MHDSGAHFYLAAACIKRIGATMPDEPTPTRVSRLFNPVTAYYDRKQRNRQRRADVDAQTSDEYAMLQGLVRPPTDLEATRLQSEEAAVVSPPEETIDMCSNPFRYDAARLEKAHEIIAEKYPGAPHVQSFKRLQGMTPEEMAHLAEEGEADAIATIEESAHRWMEQRQAEVLKKKQ